MEGEGESKGERNANRDGAWPADWQATRAPRRGVPSAAAAQTESGADRPPEATQQAPHVADVRVVYVSAPPLACARACMSACARACTRARPHARVRAARASAVARAAAIARARAPYPEREELERGGLERRAHQLRRREGAHLAVLVVRVEAEADAWA
eukprot:736908-Pleurochrysis_carterae.AAC.1